MHEAQHADAKTFFQLMVDEEQRHVGYLRAQLDFVTGTGYWFDVREFNLEG